jgi:RNA recognition motif-containing protein
MGGGGGGGDGRVSGNRVHVSGLPTSIKDGELRDIFGKHGNVLGLQKIGGGPRGQTNAIIRYASPEDAQAAISALNGRHEVHPGDGPISCKLAKPNPRWDT